MLRADAIAADRLETVAEQVDYAIVGPADNRVHEIATTRFPFNTICHVERDFGDGRWRGCSGVLIGPGRVLTAAHCLYNLLLRRAPVRIRVSPGRRDRGTRPFGSVNAVAAYIPGLFRDGGPVAPGLRLRRRPAGTRRSAHRGLHAASPAVGGRAAAHPPEFLDQYSGLPRRPPGRVDVAARRETEEMDRQAALLQR